MSAFENIQLIQSLNKDQNSFKLQPKEVKENKNIVIELLPKYPHIFDHISKILKDDQDVAIEAIKSSSYNFHHLNSRLKKDKQLFMMAAFNYGLILESFDHFSDDKEAVLVAVNQVGKSVKYASERLKKDIDVAKSAMRIDPNNFLHLDSSLKNNRELFLYAVGKNGFALQYAHEDIKNDEEIVLLAVDYNREVLKFASSRLQDKLKSVEHNDIGFNNGSIDTSEKTTSVIEKAKTIRMKSIKNNSKNIVPTIM